MSFARKNFMIPAVVFVCLVFLLPLARGKDEVVSASAKTWTVEPRDHLDDSTVNQLQQDETGQKIELERYFNKSMVDKRLASDRTNNNQLGPSVIADADGNIYIAFTKDDGNIMMQKLNSSGEVQWEQDKQVFVSDCPAPQGVSGNRLATVLHPNGIVVIANCYVGIGQNDIWAQLVSTSGVAQWAADTRVNDNTANNKYNQEVEVLGSDIYIAWADDRTASGTYEMYAQKLNSSGSRTISGDQALVTPGVNLLGPRLKKTPSNKLLLSYINTSNNQIWVRQYDSSFTLEWGPSAAGTTTSPTSKAHFATTVIGDNSYYFFRKFSTSPPNYQIYGQSLNSVGGTRWNGGLDLRVGRRVVPGGILAWNDGTNPYFASTEFSGAAYPCGKKVDAATGAVLWGGIFDNEPKLIVGSYVPPHQPAVSIIFSGSVSHVVYSNLNGTYQADVYYNSFDTSGTITHASDIMINRDYGVLHQQAMKISKDSGGDIVGAWLDSRTGELSTDVYVQKFNSSGTSQWTGDTKANSATSNCGGVDIVVNGTDSYVVWGASGNVWLNKINGSGVRQWADLRVNVGAASQTSSPSLSYDGTNIIVVWEDNRGGDGNLQVYYNAVSTAGVVQLGADVRVTIESATKKVKPKIRSDGTNAFVVWEDSRNGSNEDIYMQKINSSGVPQYASDVKIDNVGGIFNSSNNPNFVLSGGNIYVIWEDDRGTGDAYTDIYLAGFNGETRLFDDVLVNDSSSGDKVNPAIGVSDGALYIVWKDKRDSSTYTDIYMAKFNTSGIKRYANDAQVNVDSPTVIHSNPTMTLDDSYVGWDDDRNGATNKDIFLARGVDLVKTNGKMYGGGLIHDTGTNNVRYEEMDWTVTKPLNTAVKFRTRSADTQAELPTAEWSSYYMAVAVKDEYTADIVQAKADIESPDRRFLEVEINLETSDTSISPAVQDVTIQYLTNEAPVISSLSVSADASGEVNFSYNVADSDSATVVMSFEYWDGSAWKTTSNVTGMGSKSVGATYTGVWDAAQDLPNASLESKIRLTADDQASFNNTDTEESPPFSLDTRPTPSATPTSSSTTTGTASSTATVTASARTSRTISPSPEASVSGIVIVPIDEPSEIPDEPPLIEPSQIDEKIREFIEVLSLASQTPSGQAAMGITELLLAAPVIFGPLLSAIIGIFSSILNITHHPFPAATVPRHRRKGYVFDFKTKKPIGLARVKIFSVERDNLVYQDFTNREGEFVMLLPKGEFYLTVEKGGYELVKEVPISSKKPFNADESDGYYDAIYYPESIIRVGEAGVMNLSIPLNPRSRSYGIAGALRVIWGAVRQASYVFFVIGTLLAIFLLIADPKAPVNIAISLFYLLLWIWLIYNFVTYEKKAGRVVTTEKAPLPLAIIRVFDLDMRLVQTAVTNEKGNFVLNLSRGNYRLEIRKPGFEVRRASFTLKSLMDIADLNIALERAK